MKPAAPRANESTYQLIALAQIQTSADNPRKTFDEAKLAELADSIRSKGILEPLLVRFQPRSSTVRGDLFELVAGERRYRAAKLAGVQAVPCIVRELSDKEADEVRLIENEQREDLGPMEKAEGYQHLIDRHGYTVEDLAGRVGKSVSTIRGLLRLRQLPAKARTAVEEGTLSASTAELIARVPTPKLRERVGLVVVAGIPPQWIRGQQLVDSDEKDFKRLVTQERDGSGPLSYRAAKALIEQECMVELKGAKFDQKELYTLPGGAGTPPGCGPCPKRVGTLAIMEPETYAGVRADICMDPHCFRAKTAAHQARLREEAKASGKKVLTGKESAAVFSQWSNSIEHNAPYLDVEARCEHDPKRRSFKKLVGKQLAGDVVLAEDRNGELRQLLPKDKVKAALKAMGIGAGEKAERLGEDADTARWRKQQAAERKKAEASKEAARLANGQVAERLLAVASKVSAWPVHLVEMLQVLVGQMASEMWSDACHAVAKRRELEGERRDGSHRDSVKALADKLLTGPDLLALMAELIAARTSLGWGASYSNGTMNKEETAFWRAFGVDRKCLLSDVAAEAKEKKAAKKAPKPEPAKNGTPKPTPQANGPAIVDRNTILYDLVSGDFKKVKAALKTRGLVNVGDLLDRAEMYAEGPKEKRPFVVLQSIKGLSSTDCSEIFDALADGGLLEEDVRQQLPKDPAGDAELAAAMEGRKGPKVFPEQITDSTPLIDLVSTGNFANMEEGLKNAGLYNVSDLLDKIKERQDANRHERKTPISQLAYAVLRWVHGFTPEAANEVGDALIDAGIYRKDAVPA